MTDYEFKYLLSSKDRILLILSVVGLEYSGNLESLFVKYLEV